MPSETPRKLRLVAVAGCVIVLALLVVPPYGKTVGSTGRTTKCASVLGAGPSYKYPGNLEDTWWDYSVDESGQRREAELWHPDQQNAVNACDARRTRHLALALIVAVPTAACLGAWITINTLNARRS
ncbi:hypothetical protein [Allosalinactinospora lopnorensis]|uniref:hypothetical protein n=1 Tax=Allosalinactinospora lopnorensis TaxID=1352348 RepID=UPI0012E27F9E|nr:hypothetical protein [Allosalinactinospora lopnorensis]